MLCYVRAALLLIEIRENEVHLGTPTYLNVLDAFRNNKFKRSEKNEANGSAYLVNRFHLIEMGKKKEKNYLSWNIKLEFGRYQYSHGSQKVNEAHPEARNTSNGN